MTESNKPLDSDEKGAITPIVDFFKHLVGFDLNAIISMAAPESTKAAQALADSVKNRFPEQHWLRSTLAYRAVGVLASRVESAGEGQTKSVKAILEKFSDFIEEFGQSLWQESSHTDNGKKTSLKHDAGKAVQVFEDLNKQFLEKSRLRLETATKKEFDGIKERIGTEAKLLAELKILMTEGPKEEPKPEVPKELKKPWMNSIEPLVTELEAKNKVWKAENVLRMVTPPRQQSWLGRLLLWPWKMLAGIVFGFPKKTEPEITENLQHPTIDI